MVAIAGMMMIGSTGDGIAVVGGLMIAIAAPFYFAQ